MLEVLESIRRIVYRWTKTNTPLTATAFRNDVILTVDNTNRFLAGDAVAIHNGTEVEYLIIQNIIDGEHVQINSPGIQSLMPWLPQENTIVEKLFFNHFVQGIYIGDPKVIPKYPAISIMGESRSSDWYALQLTKEKYNIKITTYVEDATLEDGYYFLNHVTDAIETGLKRNIFPLVGPTDVSDVLFDLNANDVFIKVANANLYPSYSKIILEDKFKAEELRVVCIVDDTTIQVFPNVKNSYNVADGAKLIKLTRFIHKSWPAEIEYGAIHKDTLLKASTISWYGEEMLPVQPGGWQDPQLS